jgi:hypothetical protein
MEFSLFCGFSKFFIDTDFYLFAKSGGEKRSKIAGSTQTFGKRTATGDETSEFQ